jgi:hypothetical protein
MLDIAGRRSDAGRLPFENDNRGVVLMNTKSLSCTAILLAILPLVPAFALAAAIPGPPVGLFDTGVSSAAPLSGRAVAARAGWTLLAEDQTRHAFTGDAALANDRLTVVFRRHGPGAEVYAHGAGDPVLRAVLRPLASGAPAGTASITVAENTAGAVALDAGGPGAMVRYELQPGRVFVRTEARGAVAGLRLESPCRFAVLPDFFADDIAVDARELPFDRAELPSENFLLHMAGHGEAIVVAVWSRREEEVQITLAGRGEARLIRASEIRYGPGGSIQVAVLEGPGVWHWHGVKKTDAGHVIPLDWRAPFPAQWRMDWRQADGLTDSWEMVVQKADGTYAKLDWFGQSDTYGTPDWMRPDRSRWTTVLGWFRYPCWIDRQGQGFIEPLARPGKFQGPALIYPINRVPATPLAAFTFVDIMRATLGVGPCEYVLDVEGQKKKAQGIATCAARTKLDDIYARGQQVARRAEVEQALVDVLAFVRHIRARIEAYAAFGHQMRGYLDTQKKARPELADFLARMETLTGRIDAAIAPRRPSINTPEHASRLAAEFRATLLSYEGADALARCARITAGFVQIGGNQDELVGECRVAVKNLRQRAALAAAADPRAASVAREIRIRTQAMLRNPTGYEAPRH